MANFIIGVSGSIAAYKIPQLTHELIKSGHSCKVILTNNALMFVTENTFKALGAEIFTENSINHSVNIMEHIMLAKWADYLIISPASANIIARCAHGLANDLLSSTILATTATVIFVPAMNQQMWNNQLTQNNINLLAKASYQIWYPDFGHQACGDIGIGRMPEIETIICRIKNLLIYNNHEYHNCSFKDKKIVITAGATLEYIDPVRFISNLSSGKMGIALACAFKTMGAKVCLIYTKSVQSPIPSFIDQVIEVITAQDMLQQALTSIKGADIFISAAAICDFKPKSPSLQKIKKDRLDYDSQQSISLTFVANPDIIKEIKRQSPNIYAVGFAAETNDIRANAQKKLKSKNLDMIIANDVSQGKIFGEANTQLLCISKHNDGIIESGSMSKLEAAYFIAKHIAIM